MKPHETNGPGPPDPPGDDAPDPLAEAAALRAALGEVLTRAGRLVACLKHARRQTKALAFVWTSLKSLHLGPPGGRP